ncbi:MAG TPA: sn-glycerol-3-phosphate ABC transporter ATP-binding protein UgpC [Opitutaceae bacterium]|nr:sn-glycerol-3-phosphate ABC transporter ATP-binding protein UgpC [Opitutaceae bacterium]
MARVVLENLVKLYPQKNGPDVRAVGGVSLAVEDREFMVLVGPSGCGKSTTLRMIAGLEEISGGRITIDGRTVNGVPPKDRDIAMVFQNYALYPHLTVYENLAFGLKLRGEPRAEIDARVRSAAALLGLEGQLQRRPKALSGGQRQRVAVGRAIVRQPKVFLFDEPLSNLDAQMRGTMRAELAKLHDRLGATMIYVTHDQVEAMTMADRICVMKDGEVQQVAAPLELYRNPANVFVAGFIGSPPMNLFRGSILPAGGGLAFVAEDAAGTSAFSVPVDEAAWQRAGGQPGRPLVLGVRPEHLREAGSEPGALAARIELAEPMGAETHLHLNAGGAPFVARVRSSQRHRAGETAWVAFNPADAHLFDAKSGLAL